MRTLVTVSLLALATALGAATTDPISDLRFGVDILTHPEVTETQTSGGSRQKYDWDQGSLLDNLGYRVEGAYYQGMSRRGLATNGFLWAAGLNYGSFKTTAESFGSAANARPDLQTTYQQFGLMGGLGYATIPSYTSVGDLHWEILATARGGIALADTVTSGTNPKVKTGNAPWWEGGARTGIVLQDNSVLLDVHAGYAYGQCSPDIDFGGGNKSEMTIVTNSPYLGLALGIRF